MKEEMGYASPEMEIIFLDGEDVVTNSGDKDGLITDTDWWQAKGKELQIIKKRDEKMKTKSIVTEIKKKMKN